MMTENIEFSFLITHFNRSSELEKCVKSILNLGLKSFEIIVNDDASDIFHLDKVKSLQIDKLILSKQNSGLANSINKGISFCSGKYIIYCQEDFTINKKLNSVLIECTTLLNSNKADLIRFTSNFRFKKLKFISVNISLIPKFSVKNLMHNFYQYSDHPFITTRTFFHNYGFYMEQTSGRYGEMEYAIRIFKSSARIAITNEKMANKIEGSQSVLEAEYSHISQPRFSKKVYRIFRTLRLYFEYIVYNKKRRGLCTYKNLR